MSIKTLRKRIALVAVSALGVGLLSVAPASAAASTAFSPQILMLATTADANGSVATTYSPAADQTFSQVGWVTDTRATSLTTTGAGAIISSGTSIVGAGPIIEAIATAIQPTHIVKCYTCKHLMVRGKFGESGRS